MLTSFLDAGVRSGADASAALAAAVTALYEHPAYRRLAGGLDTPGCPLTGLSRARGDAAVAATRAVLAAYEQGTLQSDDIAAALAQLAPFAAAWTELPQRVETGQQAGRTLRTKAASLGLRESELELTAWAQRADTLAAELETDPLGATARWEDAFAPELRRLTDTLAAAERTQHTAADRLQRAPAHLAELTEAHAAAARLVAERDARLLDPTAPTLPAPATLAALSAWREKLDQAAAAGRWATVVRALDAWEAQLQQCERACAVAGQAAEAALEERRRLRGWLGALQAKAGATGRSEDPRFGAAALAAQQLLRSGRASLPRLRELVATCQSLLRHER